MLLIINYSESATVYIVALASQLQTHRTTRCNSIFLHVSLAILPPVCMPLRNSVKSIILYNLTCVKKKTF